MPGAHEVKGWVCCLESAGVQHADELCVIDKKVRWDQIAVRHDVRILTWQLPKARPHRPHGPGIEKALAAPDALLHPVVMVCQDPAAPTTFETASASVARAKALKQQRQVLSETGRVLTRRRSCHRPRQPRLGSPRQWVAVARAAEVERFGSRHGADETKLRGRRHLADMPSV